jgi:cysteine-rich repeat protein
MREVDLMSRRIANLAFAAALGLIATVGLSGVAQAGAPFDCGNSVIEPPETCDDGNTVSGDGCSGISCKDEVCGDNILNTDPAPGPAEECDDGNTAGGDGCDATCQLECGNGTLEGAEECDTSGQSATCDDDCTLPVCGDNNLNEDTTPVAEQCDDGNTVSGDNCSATCQLETAAQTKPQQACINGINANGTGVLKAQDKDISGCVKSVAGGKTPALADCLETDLKGKVAKAAAKTTSTNTKKCADDGLPTFAYTTPTTVNDANKDASLDSFKTVFGDPATIVLKSADKDAAACQAEILKRQQKLQQTWAAEANKAKKTALKGGAANPTELATAIDTAVAASEKITKAENGVNSGIAKKCPDAIVDPLVACGDVTTGNALALCVIAEAKREACLALELSDALALACPGDA